jgi:chromosome segregation ATPase
MEASESSSSAQDDQLDAALDQIKSDVIAKARDLREENDWVNEITKIMDAYKTKTDRVKADIAKQTLELKELLKKRRQIENLKLQNELEKKLKDAESDLVTLQRATASVKAKELAFNKNTADVTSTVAAIKAQLEKLKGGAGAAAAPAADAAPAEAAKF